MKAVAKKMVAIKVADVKNEGVLEESEVSHEQKMKKQNRGIVFMSGSDCDFAKPGDDVSFYRAAATPMNDDDGEEYQMVNEGHILAKF